MTERCPWCGTDPLYVRYHDTEWGVPLHDDTRLFEFLTLETFQAGLSWFTVLKKRENFRAAFDGFNPAKVARSTDAKVAKLMADAGLIRSEPKIRAAVQNARSFLALQEKHGSFDAYIWRFVDGTPIVNHRKELSDVPATTPLSEMLTNDLKHHGFKFIGATVTYAHMQATGMVNDHLVSCPRHRAVQQ
jgi:DNA-3-methyladenine glycosylase I